MDQMKERVGSTKICRKGWVCIVLSEYVVIGWFSDQEVIYIYLYVYMHNVYMHTYECLYLGAFLLCTVVLFYTFMWLEKTFQKIIPKL